jgi:protein subunit release factor A
METVIVEIRAAEGGDDAKALVCEQFKVYSKLAERRGL